jgi:hypothetical protein
MKIISMLFIIQLIVIGIIPFYVDLHVFTLLLIYVFCDWIIDYRVGVIKLARRKRE